MSSRNDYLEHYGVKGMKWGVRRYLNTNGTLNAEGKKRSKELNPKVKKAYEKAYRKSSKEKSTKVANKMWDEISKSKQGKDYENLVKYRGVQTSNAGILYDYSNERKVGQKCVEAALNKDAKVIAAYSKKYEEIYTKYVDEYSGAVLSDIGIEDTPAGREYLKKIGGA